MLLLTKIGRFSCTPLTLYNWTNPITELRICVQGPDLQRILSATYELSGTYTTNLRLTEEKLRIIC